MQVSVPSGSGQHFIFDVFSELFFSDGSWSGCDKRPVRPHVKPQEASGFREVYRGGRDGVVVVVVVVFHLLDPPQPPPASSSPTGTSSHRGGAAADGRGPNVGSRKHSGPPLILRGSFVYLTLHKLF